MTRYYTRQSHVCFEGSGPATSVSYDQNGRTYDIHHWKEARWANLHAQLLNEGMSREDALQAAKDA